MGGKWESLKEIVKKMKKCDDKMLLAHIKIKKEK